MMVYSNQQSLSVLIVACAVLWGNSAMRAVAGFSLSGGFFLKDVSAVSRQTLNTSSKASTIKAKLLVEDDPHEGDEDDALSSSSGRMDLSRRSFFANSVPFCAAASTICGLPDSAWAEGPPSPVTKRSITAAFDAIRAELTGDFVGMGSGGGVRKLESLILAGKYDTIVDFTKVYDSSFRKYKLAFVHEKLMTDKTMKTHATMVSNAVTYDLIGINRASRTGNKKEAMRYLQELKADIEKFLAFEKKMKVSRKQSQA